MKKFELKWKLYNYISIRKVGPQVCTNILDHLSGSLLQD